MVLKPLPSNLAQTTMAANFSMAILEASHLVPTP